MTITNANVRTFGIEIETSVPISSDIRTGGQVNNAPSFWKGKSDCSIDASYNHRAVEIVSPVLAGEEGLIQVWYMGDMLRKLPASSNRSCGVHVHVGALGFDNDTLRHIVKQFKVYERAFYALNGIHASARWSNETYCKPSAQWGYDYRNVYRDTDGLPTYDRYQSLNLTNVGSSGKNTVEFRLFASIIDPAFLITACTMSVAFITACINGFVAPSSDEGITDHGALSRLFVRRFLTKPDNRIVPEVDSTDTSKYLLAQASAARF